MSLFETETRILEHQKEYELTVARAKIRSQVQTAVRQSVRRDLRADEERNAWLAVAAESADDPGLYEGILASTQPEKQLYLPKGTPPRQESFIQQVNLWESGGAKAEGVPFEQWRAHRNQQAAERKVPEPVRTIPDITMTPIRNGLENAPPMLRRLLLDEAYEDRVQQNGPTVRSANSLYLSKATGMEIEHAATVYDSLVHRFFGDREPDDIRPLSKLVRRWYTDSYLEHRGIDPAIYRAAKAYAHGADEDVDWDVVFANMDADQQSTFTDYVQQLTQPKQRGFWGKVGETLKRASMRSVGTIARHTVLTHPEMSGITAQVKNEMLDRFRAANGGAEPFGIEAYVINEQAQQEAIRRTLAGKKAGDAKAAGDPVKGGNLLSKMTLATASVAPDMLTSLAVGAATGTGPVGTGYYWYVQTAGGIYEDMTDLGFRDDTARMTAKVTALPVAATELLQVSQLAGITGRAKAKAAQAAGVSMAKYLASRAGRYAADVTMEIGEEVIQSTIQVGGEAAAAVLAAEKPEINWMEDVIGPQLEGLKEAALAFPLLVGGGHAVNLTSESKYIRKMTRAGIPSEIARGIAVNPAAVQTAMDAYRPVQIDGLAEAEAANQALRTAENPPEGQEQSAGPVPSPGERLESPVTAQAAAPAQTQRVQDRPLSGVERNALLGDTVQRWNAAQQQLGAEHDLTEYLSRRIGILKRGGDTTSLANLAMEYGIDETAGGDAEPPISPISKTTEEKSPQRADQSKIDEVLAVANDILTKNGISAEVVAVDKTILSDETFEQTGTRPTGATIFEGDGKPVIQLAFAINEAGQTADVETAAHEGWHVVRRSLDAEAAAVLDTAFDGDLEAEARAFGQFHRALMENQAIEPGAVETVLRKIWNLLKRIAGDFRKSGYQTAEDVFEAVSTGRANPTSAAQRQVSELADVQFEMKEADLSPSLTHYYHNAQGAIRALSKLQRGEAVAALYHPEVGDIDLIWGGNAAANPKHNYGLAKIVQRHPEVVDHLQAVLESMQVRQSNENRKILESENHEAVIRLNWYGKDKKWLLTAYEKRKPSSSERLIDVPGNPENGPAGRQAPRPGDDSPPIIGKKDTAVKENPPDVQFELKDGGKTREDERFEADVEEDVAAVMAGSDPGRVKAFLDDLDRQAKALIVPEFGEDIRAATKVAWAVFSDNGAVTNDLTLAAVAEAAGALAKYQSYETSARPSKAWFGRRIEGLETLVSEFSRTLNKWIVPMTSRLQKISPVVFQKVRAYEMDVFMRTAAMGKQASPFLEAVKNLRRSNIIEYRQLWRAMLNGETGIRDRLLDKHGLTEAFKPVRGVLDTLFDMANQVGMQMPYRREHWPRMIVKMESFLEFLYGTDMRSLIDEAVRKSELARGGRKLEDEERIRLINSLLRGFRVGGLTLSRSGHAMERRIEFVDETTIDYYGGIEESLMDYIVDLNTRIAQREFFARETVEMVNLRAEQSRLMTRLNKLSGAESGKVFSIREGWKTLGKDDYKQHLSQIASQLEKVNERIKELDTGVVETSIGRYVNEAVVNFKVNQTDQQMTPRQESEIRDMLTAIMDPRGYHGRLAKLFVSGTYLTTLGSPLNSMSQFKELALAYYRSTGSAIPSTVKALLGKAEITPEAIGIENVGEEFSADNLSRLVRKVLTVAGFSEADRLGKTVYLNTVLRDYRKKAATLTAETVHAMASGKMSKSEFYSRIEKVFGDRAGEVIGTLRSGGIDWDVKLLLFNELSDIQPISVAEMPEYYARGGNGRIFYMLKSFTVRQVDFMRREIFADLTHKKTACRGLRKLAKLVFMLEAFGVSNDLIKALVTGRDDFELPDSFANNLLQYALMSRYTLSRMNRYGYGRGYLEGFLPPVKTLDDLTDATEGDWVRSVPVGGELYYWWFGAGANK